ncbi:hypothetical protein V6N13_096770 [Hibiscus sabdariffa]
MFYMNIRLERKWKEEEEILQKEESANKEDECFKKPSWQQLEHPEMVISEAGNFMENKRKNSKEPAQSTEQTRTESVLTLQGRGPIDYRTIKNPTFVELKRAAYKLLSIYRAKYDKGDASAVRQRVLPGQISRLVFKIRQSVVLCYWLIPKSCLPRQGSRRVTDLMPWQKNIMPAMLAENLLPTTWVIKSTLGGFTNSAPADAIVAALAASAGNMPATWAGKSAIDGKFCNNKKTTAVSTKYGTSSMKKDPPRASFGQPITRHL